MRVPLDWLAEWIDLPPQDLLVQKLTSAGLEIEEVLESGPDFAGLLVGRVLSCEKHPNADKLSLCAVDAGGEALSIICGAPNVAAGQWVAVAPQGSVLPGGQRIKRAKIRGVESNGMICSAAELGIGEDHDGILVLEDGPALAPGAPLRAALGGSVLDLEITPNRGDWLSMLGIARELRANFGGALREPDCEVKESGKPGGGPEIAIADAQNCHCYAARVVRDVAVGPSPDWLAGRLTAAGIRPQSNVVDVTNFVMLEFGQPLHAFDLDCLRGGVQVRRAAQGESLQTLDGQQRELCSSDLVIADAEGALAIAGVMGGARSEVRAETRHVLLESAHFSAASVRRTAKRLGMQSDASYRFERGVDPGGQLRALNRAAKLLAELAGGRVCPGVAEARGQAAPEAGEIRLDPGRVNHLLGTALSPGEITELLERVDVKCRADGEGLLHCTPPPWRNDLHIWEDLAEEVARIHGYDEIPETLPPCEAAGITLPPRRETRERLRSGLAAAGLSEVMTPPWSAETEAGGLRLSAEDSRRRLLRLRNPIHAERPFLRGQLVGSLLRVARLNWNRQAGPLRCFEISRVHRAASPGEGGLPAEPLEAVALIANGGAEDNLWDSAAPAFFQLKGVAERLLAELHLPARFRACAEGEAPPFLHPGAAGEFTVRGQRVAALGELHPETAAHFEIERGLALLTLDVDALDTAQPAPPRYRAVPRHPRVQRDLALLLNCETPAGEIARAIREAGGDSLADVAIFDRYQGRGVPAGKLGLGFRLLFQRADRTLHESEVAAATGRVLRRLQKQFGAELRGGETP